MAARILITMDDLSTAVPLNAAFEAAGFSTAMFSSLDDPRGTVRRESPELVILTGAVHEPHALQLAALARDNEISTLALLEPTDSERAERVGRLGVTAHAGEDAPPEWSRRARGSVDPTWTARWSMRSAQPRAAP